MLKPAHYVFDALTIASDYRPVSCPGTDTQTQRLIAKTIRSEELVVRQTTRRASRIVNPATIATSFVADEITIVIASRTVASTFFQQ